MLSYFELESCIEIRTSSYSISIMLLQCLEQFQVQRWRLKKKEREDKEC